VLARLEELEGVEVRCPVAVTGIETKDTSALLSLEDSKYGIEARLVVAADGAQSLVREMLNVPVQTRDYSQTAIICNITPEHHHAGRAFERLTPSGPFAVLPHAGDRCGLVWSVASEDAGALMEMDEADFLTAAQQRFGNELGEFLRMGKRSSYPLKLVRAKRDIHQRCVIIGNAAHTIHPVGAQGFNLGLRDAAVLAETLADSGNRDPGELSLLQQYDAWRQPDEEATIRYSDGLARIFSNPSFSMGAARFLGMALHQIIPPLRRRLAMGAMGYRGRIPRLARGERLVDKNGC